MDRAITKGQAFGLEEPHAARSGSGPEEALAAAPSRAAAGTRRGAERGKLVKRTWVVPEDVARDFKVECAKRGLNGSDVVGTLIEEWLAGVGEGGA